MTTEQVQTRVTAPFSMRAAPSTINEEARTVTVRISTPSGVEVWDWDKGEFITQHLDPDAVDLPDSRQVPMLDTHSRWSVDDVLGSLRNIRAEDDDEFGRSLFADAHFEDEEKSRSAFRKIKNGHLTDFSVGFEIKKSSRIEKDETEELAGRKISGPAQIVTKWRLLEASLVPIGADPSATVRAAGETSLSPGRNNNMADHNKTTEVPPGGGVIEQAAAKLIVPDNTANVVEIEAARAEGEQTATTRERQRAAEIDERAAIWRSSSLIAGNDEAHAELETLRSNALKSGKTGDDFGREAVKLMERVTASSTTTVHMGEDHNDSLHERMVDSILLRAGVQGVELHDGASEFANRSLIDLGRELLPKSLKRGNLTKDAVLRQYEGTRPRSSMSLGVKVSERALNHSTSDFVDILADAQGKSLQAAYAMTPSTHQLWTRKVSLPDFKDRKVKKMSVVPQPSAISEAGEFQETVLTDDGESYALSTYGHVISITRESLINDDLDAFARIPQSIGASYKRFQGRKVYQQLLNPSLMSDGVTLFDDTAHGNHISSGTVINVQNLGIARAKMRKQKALNAKDGDNAYLGIEAQFLIVPTSLFVTASQVLNSQFDPANANNTVNPFQNKFTIIEEVELENEDNTGYSAISWYLAANPMLVDTMEVGYLNGNEMPTVTSEEPFNMLGMRTRSFVDIGVGQVEWKGLLKNNGA